MKLQEAENFWAKVCFDPDYEPEGRFATYRRLVTNRFLEVLKNICPVARELLSDEEWKILLWDYLKNAPPKSEIIRELPREFSQYLRDHDFPLKDRYPYLGELIEYEYLEIAMRFAPEDEGSADTEKLRLNPAHALGSYRWPVHFIKRNFSTPEKLSQGEFHLLLWRDNETLVVRFMEVNAVVAALVRLLESGPRDPEALLKSVAESSQIAAGDDFMAEGRALLKELTNQGILY